MFLFNDRLLVCSVGSWNHSYKVKAWFEVEQLNVLEGDNLITEFTFYISDGSKEIELYTSTRKEKEEWVSALTNVITDLRQKKQSLKTNPVVSKEVLKRIPDDQIGKTPPPQVSDVRKVNKCMSPDCTASLRGMRQQKQCKACGIVICTKCSSQKFKLDFEKESKSTVCKYCHELLERRKEEQQPTTTSQTENGRLPSTTTSNVPDSANVGGGKGPPKNPLEMVKGSKNGIRTKTSQ